jgi:hypothetical protein
VFPAELLAGRRGDALLCLSWLMEKAESDDLRSRVVSFLSFFSFFGVVGCEGDCSTVFV